MIFFLIFCAFVTKYFSVLYMRKIDPGLTHRIIMNNNFLIRSPHIVICDWINCSISTLTLRIMKFSFMLLPRPSVDSPSISTCLSSAYNFNYSSLRSLSSNAFLEILNANLGDAYRSITRRGGKNWRKSRTAQTNYIKFV